MDVSYNNSPSDDEEARFSAMPERTLPNILVTGTPGTGKTSTAEMVAQLTSFEHMEIGKLVREQQLHDGYLEEYDSLDLNEDKLLDYLEEELRDGGKVVDFHGSDLFPEDWFDLVVVLRTNNTLLYDRLQGRGYTESKVQENIECEIFQECLEEARSQFPEEMIVELVSETADQMESNAERIQQWAEAFMAKSKASP
ncbi:AAA domain-containing protein [Piptocephalis cylindrospora]|uniref:Adenylate kinase isoenzyme 6 homolog n=1 Tax=Piptocephalis cylindrospora TaxID=1907219 RepID=A0A4P9Y5J1_9FUNG|nr:AAA domain-containing protein [Piptocephalis cylindrospora]|eukprot:RKP13461.1 AAA domain-containing protein [Piptocephalis cylindrospora]